MGIFTKKEKNIDFQIEETNRLIAGQKVNHILHLLLCIPTVGFWAIIWVLVVISSSMETSRLKRELEKLYKLKNTNASESIHNSKESSAEKLIKLAELLEKGLITDEEFKVEKEKLI